MVDYLPIHSTQDQEIQHYFQGDFQIANRALRVLSACTQAVIRATDEEALLQKMVQLITEEAAYRMAWIGYVCYDESKSIKPMAWAGHESNYLQTIKVTWADVPLGQGPTGRAIRSRQPVACQNMLEDPSFAPWRESAKQRGYQSSIVLPLLDQKDVFACLNIYSTEADAFSLGEVALLSELADSLSFGISSLRIKQNRQKAELALRISEDKFSKAFYSSPIPKTITTVAEGRYIDVNRSFEKLFGYSRAEIINHTSLELGIWHNLQDRLQMFEQLEAHGKLVKYETCFQSRDKQLIICKISSEFLHVADELCILTAVEDITDHRQSEKTILHLNAELEQRVQARTSELTQVTEKLQLLNQELQRSNQELEQFAYVASHDLQEPLRAVMGYTQLLMSEYGDRFNDEAKSYADYVIDGAKRMQQLIQDLLIYSRVGTRGNQFSPIDCNQVIKEAMRNLQIAIAEKNANITIEPLPMVNGDQGQLVQLFQNLIGNALKFCRDEQPLIHISTIPEDKLKKLNQAEDQQYLRKICFQVSDNGIGIKSQYLERIFEVFKRLHTRREYAGTGIGLAICKKIVLRHGGKIWAESTPDVGTTFYFTIPIYEQQSELPTN